MPGIKSVKRTKKGQLDKEVLWERLGNEEEETTSLLWGVFIASVTDPLLMRLTACKPVL